MLAGRIRLAIAVDSVEGIERLAAAVAAAGSTIDVFVEVDVGHGRCGCPAAAAGPLAQHVVAHAPPEGGLRFAGVQAYHGAAQHLRGGDEREAASHHAASLARAAQASIGAAGIACPLVTGAGTGTFVFDAASGVWGELQAGSYLFMDRDYADNAADAGRAALRARALRQEPGDEPRRLARGRRCRPQVARDRLRAAARRGSASWPTSTAATSTASCGRTPAPCAPACRRSARRCGSFPATATRPSTCTTATSSCAAACAARRRRSGLADRGARLRQLSRERWQPSAMTGPQIIVLATPVFLALIGVELAIGRARGAARLSPERCAVEHRPRHDEPGRRRLHAVLTLGIYVAGARPLRASGDLRRRRRGLGRSAWSPTTSSTTGITAPATAWRCSGPRTSSITRARTTTSRPRCARRRAAGWSAGSSTCRWRSPAFRRSSSRVVALIDLLYQFWVHTEQVGRLGWFDRWFCAPSNHRVHHAVNDALPRSQLRRHPDRLGPPLRHLSRRGPRASLASTARARRCSSWNPICANLQVYADARPRQLAPRRWADKLRVWLKPPGWRPADVAARWPKAPFAIDAFERYAPAPSRAGSWLAFGLFVALLAATTLFLWHSHALAWSERAAAALAIGAALWAVGRLSEGKRAPSPGSSGPRHCADHDAMTEDRLPPSLLTALAAHGNSRAFRAQTILINEGDSGGSLYIVLEGRLRAYASSPRGATSFSPSSGPANTSASCRSTARPARRR